MHRSTQLCGLLLLAVPLLCSAATPADTALSPSQRALHVLNRLGYGPRPGDLQHVLDIGVESYIAQQLDPDRIPESPRVRQQLDALDTLQLTSSNLFTNYGPPTIREAGDDEAARKAAREHANIPVTQAIAARVIRAVDSPRQLQEVMTEFWFNHFNVFEGKGLDHIWVGNYEQTAIRPFALGHFRDLLEATAKHPAMLFYLDNWQSAAPNAKPRKNGKQQVTGLNENYAREVMELHTLGVNGGYSQKDVIELARILTGWTYTPYRPHRWFASAPGEFTFDDERHDHGDKIFLGQNFNDDGQSEGERALDMLAASPATAKHLSTQLAQYFVGDNPSPTLVARLSRVYLDTHGDIRAVLKSLFASPEFWSPTAINTQFKTPYQYVVSGLRAMDAHVSDAKPVQQALRQLGMPIYGRQTPDGYPLNREAWLNPDAMTRRVNLAISLTNNIQKIDSANAQADAATIDASRDHSFSDKTLKASANAPLKLRAAVLIGSPEFMYR